jgi:hypothetical protein
MRLASERLGVPVDRLSAADGAITATSDRAKRVTYGELVNGQKLNVPLDRSAKQASEQVVLARPPRTRWPRCDGTVPVRPQRARARHGTAAPSCPAVGWRHTRPRRRNLGEQHTRHREWSSKTFRGVVTRKPWQAIQAAKSSSE